MSEWKGSKYNEHTSRYTKKEHIFREVCKAFWDSKQFTQLLKRGDCVARFDIKAVEDLATMSNLVGVKVS